MNADSGVAVELGPDLLEELLREPVAAHPAQRIRAARQRLRLGILVAELVAGAVGGITLAVLARLHPGESLLTIFAFVVGWQLLGTVAGVSTDLDPRPWTTTIEKAKRTASLGLVVAWIAFAILGSTGAHHAGPIAFLAATLATATAIAGRAATHAVIFRSRALAQRTVIIGSGVVARQVVDRLNLAPHSSIEVIGLVDDDVHHESSPLLPTLGTLDEFAEVVRQHDVDRVIIAFTRSGHDYLLRVIRTCWEQRIAIDIVPRLFEFLDGARAIDHVGGLPMLSITVPQLSTTARVLKRTCDIVLSLIGLVIAAPVLAVLAVLILLDSRGPVIFRQQRAGRDGRPFEILKLRSMHLDAEARRSELSALNDLDDGVLFKIYADPRITRVGRLLRKSSLDELPQLINVLRGQMSLVGPRPLVPEEVAGLGEDWHRRRLDLRPGITGPWQIYGRSDVPFQDMLRFDYQYVAGWSLGRDFEILLSTVPVALSGRGAY